VGSLFKPAIEVFRGLEGGSGINIFLFLALVGFHCPEHPKEIKKAFEEIVRWAYQAFGTKGEKVR